MAFTLAFTCQVMVSTSAMSAGKLKHYQHACLDSSHGSRPCQPSICKSKYFAAMPALVQGHIQQLLCPRQLQVVWVGEGQGLTLAQQPELSIGMLSSKLLSSMLHYSRDRLILDLLDAFTRPRFGRYQLSKQLLCCAWRAWKQWHNGNLSPV
jgi:hypothetical protein